MPLSDGNDFASLRSGQIPFIIFFSSQRNGRLWCPDCVAVEELVTKTFSSKKSRHAALVYVGQKEEWKAKDNAFRREPWNIMAIPTIIKLGSNGEEIGRLVEGDLTDQTKFALFLDTAS